MLEIDHLTKYFRSQWTFRPFRAIEDLSLALGEGEIFGLIGHNGAGKTTTFKLLLGLLRPTRGRALLLGQPSSSAWARQQIGFLPEQPYFYEYLSVREILDFYAHLCGLRFSERQRRIRELADRLQLGPKLGSPVRTLSKGTLQRVGIAQAIIHRPRLVILDEPMSGLDPAGRKDMRDLIRSLKSDGATIIFSSHILPDAEALCDRVGILADGHLREIVDLKRLEEGSDTGFELVASGVERSILEGIPGVTIESVAAEPACWRIAIRERSRVPVALRAIQESGGFVESLSPVTPSLEERFLVFANDAHAGS